MKFGSLITGVLAAAVLIVASCGPKNTPATPAAKNAAPAAAPRAATPAAAPRTAAPTATAANAAAPAAPAGGANAGAPPTPPPPPPAVMPAPVTPIVSGTAPSPDPRVGLKAGRWDAGQAAWNMKMVSQTPPSKASMGATHSDLAFTGKYAIQGNYNGFEIWDVSNPAKPVLANAYTCPASQNDISVYKNLLFMSSEATASRVDCKFGGVPDPVSKERVRGIRIFDISNVKAPKLVTSVQTCRGSHTHTLLTPPGDNENVYIYVSGTSNVRSADELPGCANGGIDDPNSARFRLEVIKVPLANPKAAAIVSSPRIFNGLPVPPANPERAAIDAASRGNRGGAAGARGATGASGASGAAAGGRGQRGPQGPPTGPNQCHDITVYPQIGLAGGACAGLGLLLDIHDPAHPVRLDAAADKNMSFWHSATFSNDGSKILFSDEWGGGTQPRCRATDKMEWGADSLFTIENKKFVFHSYYKMPAAQTEEENCVAHNGSLIPIPGREVMVQAFYQGGLTIFDWTDVAHPKEIGFFDRGPIDATRRVDGGSWSAYWYNGLIVSSEIARGLDIYELVPSPLLSQNEIDAAKTVHQDYLNVQDQQKLVWPASFVLAKAYVDQLERSKGLAAAQVKSTRDALAAAEKANGGARKTALTQLATQLNGGMSVSSDQAKLKMLVGTVNDLAK